MLDKEHFAAAVLSQRTKPATFLPDFLIVVCNTSGPKLRAFLNLTYLHFLLPSPSGVSIGRKIYRLSF